MSILNYDIPSKESIESALADHFVATLNLAVAQAAVDVKRQMCLAWCPECDRKTLHKRAGKHVIKCLDCGEPSEPSLHE